MKQQWVIRMVLAVMAGFFYAQTVMAAGWGVGAKGDLYVSTGGNNAWSGTNSLCIAPDGPKATIQTAIDAAVDGNVIVVMPGRYTGPGNYNIQFKGKAITVQSTTPNNPETVEATIVDCQGNSSDNRRGFIFIGAGVNSVLDGISIFNGYAEQGGGILFTNYANPKIINCIFSKNHASNYFVGGGGACILYNCKPTFINCLFKENTGLMGGGAASLDSSPIFDNCTFTHNSDGGIGIRGGNPILNQCSFVENTGFYWGGMCNSSSSTTLNNCMFIKNGSSTSGGGLLNEKSTVLFHGCFLVDNTAVYGGGMINNDCDISFINCIMLNNRSDRFGGAIRNGGGSSELINCTLKGNTSEVGGGIYSENCNPVITNTICWGNSDINGAGEKSQIAGTAAVINYSCIQGWTGALGGVHNMGDDPLFIENGLLKPEMENAKLYFNSPCTDAGNNEIVPIDITEDGYGNVRFYDDTTILDTGNGSAPIIDIGAYEINAPAPIFEILPQKIDFRVHDMNDPSEVHTIHIRNRGTQPLSWKINGDCPWLKIAPDNGITTNEASEVVLRLENTKMLEEGHYKTQIEFVCDDAINNHLVMTITLDFGCLLHVPEEYPTIQKALDAAVDGDTVIVMPGVYSSGDIGGRSFGGKAITVRSENPDDPGVVASTIIDGKAYYGTGISFNSQEGHDSILSGFTITNCTSYYGAGISCDKASPTIENCIIDKTNYYGVRLNESSPIFRNCLIKNNRYGIYLTTCGTDSVSTFENCEITDNNAVRGAGGRINASARSYQHDGANFINCKILRNSGTSDAGMWIDSGYVSFRNCLFSENAATDSGGGLGIDGGAVTIENCTFTRNTAGKFGGGIALSTYNYTAIKNTIIWNNSPDSINGPVNELTFSDIQGGFTGVENINLDPLFKDPSNKDFRLQLQSPCISTGDPRSDCSRQPQPNGGRINMGVYGNTPDATIATDQDNDQMPDTWEIVYHLNTQQDDSQNDDDNDGLKNMDEYRLGCDPGNSDTDNDTMPDAWEHSHYLNPLKSDGQEDSDEDGLINKDEYVNNTDPQDGDTDKDLLPDGWEVTYHLDPLHGDAHADNDGDGLTNIEEYNSQCNPIDSDTDHDLLSDYDEIRTYGTQPTLSDSDGDGLDDGKEILTYHTNPLIADTDGDNMTDGWEAKYNLNPLADDSMEDPDGDGLSNGQEFGLGTNPQSADSDDDCMPDNYEVQYGLNPVQDDSRSDLDNDGFNNIAEYVHGTPPNVRNDALDLMIIQVPQHVRYIQTAIDAALNTEEILVDDGTYTGPKNRYIRFNGKTITLRSLNGAERCILDGESMWDPFVYFNNSKESNNSIIQGFTFKNTNADAIYCYNSSPTIRNCVVRDSAGVGITLRNCAAIINHCQIIGNKNGGITTNAFNGIIRHCTLEQNQSTGLTLELGTPVVENCAIVRNSSVNVSGLYHKSGTATLRNCLIAENHSTNSVAVYIGSYTACTAQFIGCTITANRSDLLLGIYNRGTLTVTNSILWDNNGLMTGSGAKTTITYSVIEGGYTGEGNIGDNPSLDNSYHLQADSPCIDTGDPTFTVLEGETDIDGDPRILYDRVDIGADEFNYASYYDVPYIRAVPNELLIAVREGTVQNQKLVIQNIGSEVLHWHISEDCPWLDVSPVDGASAGEDNIINAQIHAESLEVGDYTANLVITDDQAVNSPKTVSVHLKVLNALKVPQEYATIQSAINASVNGDVIVIHPGVYPQKVDFIETRKTQLTLQSSNPDDWNTVAGTVVSGTGDNPVVTFTPENGPGIILKGITIRGGVSSGRGGGIAGNQTTAGIVQCIIEDNRALHGGGLADCEGLIDRCIIRNNVATGWTGGIVSVHGTITNCQIYGNTADVDAGVYSVDGQIRNCTVANNIASATSIGGIYNERGVMSNCIVWSNFPQQILLTNIPQYSCIEGWVGGGVGNMGDNPLFVDAAAGNYHLLSDSPCVDRGDPGFVPAADETDIDGQARVLGGRVDMGADEVQVVNGDVTGDGVVNLMDFAVMQANWFIASGQAGFAAACDMNSDGMVDTIDLSILLENWLTDK
jgi:hypothetical protein